MGYFNVSHVRTSKEAIEDIKKQIAAGGKLVRMEIDMPCRHTITIEAEAVLEMLESFATPADLPCPICAKGAN